MEDQEQVQNLQGQVSELKDQVSELKRLMREMSQNKPTSEPNLPLPPPPPTTNDPHQASTSFTFQSPISDPTITVNSATINNDSPFSHYPAISNADLYPSILIPPVHSTSHFPAGGVSFAVGEENKTRENEKLSALEERLRAIEGLNIYGSVDVASLRLVPDVVVPPKFKVPDFDKYTGNSDPRIHLATYIAKMSALTEDDRLLVHFFHESLSGAALRWCIQLDRSKLRSWKDLEDAFLKQYKFNCDVAPTRRDLQNLVQRDRESFKKYAQRWREKATEVYPPVTDNELCSLIEANLRMGRLQELTENPAKKTASFGKKKEVPVLLDPIQPPYPRWYDATARCEYHGGAQGHSTDNCGALKGRVHALIQNGWLKIEGNGSLPNVTSNPLPNHNTGNGVNMIESDGESSTPEVDELIPHFEEIFAMAMREGYLCPQVSGSEKGTGCPYHGGAADHELRDCEGFRQEVQNLLSLKILRCQRR
ncbi:hypothetical protein P3X46_026814 [Hevea brasiliensis]|uniref:Retrotransposon gag domain-containing protein n=1 Tax=Hevea brasiliensis TaxID=3981 RepID=A0ABQ9L0S4_HEVBR|nr:hypothetical protein P3X46_026814 [Hevea brasiliensis]